MSAPCEAAWPRRATRARCMTPPGRCHPGTCITGGWLCGWMVELLGTVCGCMAVCVWIRVCVDACVCGCVCGWMVVWDGGRCPPWSGLRCPRSAAFHVSSRAPRRNGCLQGHTMTDAEVAVRRVSPRRVPGAAFAGPQAVVVQCRRGAGGVHVALPLVGYETVHTPPPHTPMAWCTRVPVGRS